jgi:hypothetical protein
MVQAGGELFDLGGFAIGAYAAKDEDGSSAGVGEEEIAVGRGADEARHGKVPPLSVITCLLSARCMGVESPPA